MAVNRWVIPFALVFPLLPACVLTGKPTVPDEPPAPPTREFATLPRVPGDRISMHNPAVTPEPVHAVVPLEPDDLPPPAPQPLRVPEQQPSPPVVADPPLVAAVRAYLDNRPDLALEHLRALDKPNQELMLQLVPAFVDASRMNLAQPSAVEVGLFLARLDSPSSPLATLANKAQLFVDKAVFCRDIRGFGRYAPLADQRMLRVGQIVYLYVELRNTPSIRTATAADGEVFETALDCMLQIQDASGAVIELYDQKAMKMVPILHDPKRELTRSPLRDYFIAFQFPVPVKPGDYAVTVSVRHPPTHRAVSKTMPFRAQ